MADDVDIPADGLGADAEVTLEANPDDLTASKLAVYRELGVNRLSIGVQSLDDRLLTLLGRRHQGYRCVAAWQPPRR